MPPEENKEVIHPNEPVLEAILQNQDAHGTSHEQLLEAILDKSDIDSVLEAQLLQEQKTTQAVEALTKKLDPQEIGDGATFVVKGLKGDKGDQGIQGEKGERGDKGEKGDSIKGDIGKTGATGAKGPKGDTGKDGRDGLDGKDGKPGKDGKAGKDGKDGKDIPKTLIEKYEKKLKDDETNLLWVNNGAVKSVVAGNNITITGDPQNPIISSTSSGGGSFATITGDPYDNTNLAAALDLLVPYTGAVDDVDLGSNDLLASGGIFNSSVHTGGSFIFDGTPGNELTLNTETLTGSRLITFKNADGTVAFVSDIPDVSGFVPYTGAGADVELGGFGIRANILQADSNIQLNTGAQFDFYSDVGITATGSLSNTADGVYGLKYIAANSVASLDTTSLTASQTFTFPDASGTFLLDTDLSGYLASYVPYTGATGAVDLGSNTLTAKGGVTSYGFNLWQDGNVDFYSDDGLTATGTIRVSTPANYDFYNIGVGVSKLDFSSTTDDRVFTFPNATGTIALTSDIPSALTLQTDGTPNGSQTLLNLVAGTNITLTDDGLGGVTIDAGGGGAVAWGAITGTLSDQTDLQTALDGKVDENAGITGATKTKITYDAKGLVTAGTDATTADIADSANKRYVTDAQFTVIGNTSGTNTGDQTSIVGISGTKAQFDTACSDGNFLYVGDVTQYTDEMAQDAIGAMVNTSLTYVDGTPSLGLTSRTIGGVAFDGTANITVATATGGFTVSGGALALGTQNLTMTGSLAATGARVTKGWFTDVESTNMPTVGGTAILSSLTAPTFTTQSAGDNSTKVATTAYADRMLPLSGGTLTGSITLGENTAIMLDPAGSADGKWTGITMIATAGATVAFGDLVYLDAATSRWKLTDADASATAGPVHVAMCLGSSTDGNAVTLLLQGNIRADAKFPALTIGAPVYVGETAGAIQVAIPTGADNVIRVVGFALTADEIYFNPSQDHQITNA